MKFDDWLDAKRYRLTPGNANRLMHEYLDSMLHAAQCVGHSASEGVLTPPSAELSELRAKLAAAEAEIKRLRDALGTALRQWEGYADERRSVCDDWIATAKDSEACAFRAARDALQPQPKASK